MERFNLEQYLAEGVAAIVKDVVKATLTNPKASLFMAKYAKASKNAEKRRMEAERKGEHVPPFLIASITSKCNLRCAGCYARENHGCSEKESDGVLNAERWLEIFREAENLGVSFVLLAGGEPLLRQDVLHAAGAVPHILFPVFTNGTLFRDDILGLFDRYRNLVPMISVEGEEDFTDQRRGSGVYEKLLFGMDRLKERGILFGVSVTVTTENMSEVTSDAFLRQLEAKGAKAVIYVEYVPFVAEQASLAFGEEDRRYFADRLLTLRSTYKELVFIAFPGDEEESGGCLAAGCGFFHINAKGGAEPCPFSPYSDYNVKDGTLREALQSDLFAHLKDSGMLLAEHTGGCTLFARKDEVAAFLK
jgi:MoaA/NifB/PqqE/SkfB family radical SAM enzyme